MEELNFYNFIYFIDGTVKLYTDDVVNKSVVFRITEISHIIPRLFTLKRGF